MKCQYWVSIDFTLEILAMSYKMYNGAIMPKYPNFGAISPVLTILLKIQPTQNIIALLLNIEFL